MDMRKPVPFCLSFSHVRPSMTSWCQKYIVTALQAPSSCSAESFTLTLVPWTCLLDSSNNTLSCSDSFLFYEETPGNDVMLSQVYATRPSHPIRFQCILVACVLITFAFAASCTLLNISDGLLAGRQCPAEKSIGPNDDIILGGQKLELKVRPRGLP